MGYRASRRYYFMAMAPYVGDVLRALDVRAEWIFFILYFRLCT